MSLPWVAQLVHPRVRRRLPVVLSRDEVACILARMQGEHALLARLLYGTGMRISEALQLRVKDVDFSHQALIVREGKVGKDRVLMLAQSLAQPLRDQVRRFARPHRQPPNTSQAAPLLCDALAARRIRHPHSSGPARTRRSGNDHDLHTRIEDGRRRCARPARRAGCSRATPRRTLMSVCFWPRRAIGNHHATVRYATHC